MGMNGSIGSYTLEVDFDPDDSSLPNQLNPLPASYTSLVPHSTGSFAVDNQQITTGGQFLYYLLSPKVSGTYSIETFGDLDTQLGVYVGNGSLVQIDDDSGAGLNAKLSVNLTAGNDYFVVVRAESTLTGEFDMRLMGPATTTGTLVPAGLESSVTGSYASIANNERYVQYRTTAPSNATSVTVRAEVDSGSPNLNVMLRVTDSQGNIVGIADAGGAGINEQLTNIAIQANESYEITIYGTKQTTGFARAVIDFNPNFPVESGNEFTVNTTVFGGQEFPGVGRNSAGATVVAWSNRDYNRLDAQRFGANGQPAGAEFRVNLADLASITHPTVAVADDGTFVVAWVNGQNVYYRRFDNQGSPLTGDVQVNAFTGASEVKIAMRSSGEFAIVWSSFDSREPNGDIYLRRFSANGTALGSEVRVNTTITDYQGNPDIAVSSDGSFLVVWHGRIGSNVLIFGQGFASNGTTSGAEFVINAGTTGTRLAPRVAVGDEDTKVVVWQSQNQDGSGQGIYGRRLDASNSFLGDAFRVNTQTSGDQTDPVVAMASQGKSAQDVLQDVFWALLNSNEFIFNH